MSSSEQTQAPAKKEKDHFQTDHLLKNLSGRAVSGGIVTAIAQGTRFGLYMISTIVLARLLSKEDFGLVAMVGALISFLRMFREAGLSTATMQKENITHAQVSNLFWINVALGVTASAVGALLSPGVAWFFNDHRLVGITSGLCLTFLFSGSSVQHLALLNRQMRFKLLACVDIGSTALGAIVSVTLALNGWGPWSLVGGQLSTSITEMILAWTFSSWRPQWPRRGSDTRSLLSFGASLTFSTLLRRITGGADGILIGKFQGAEALGIYSRGMALLMRPLDQMIVPFDIVFIPILSRLQSQPERYKITYLKVLSAIALVSFPVAALLLALSRPLVLLMLGPRWDQVVPIFTALSLVALFYPLICVTFWLPSTQKRSEDIVALGIMNSVVPVIGYSIGLPYGVSAVAWSFSLAGLLVRLPLQFHYAGRSGHVRTGDLWGVFLRFIPLWILVGAVTFGVRLLLEGHSPVVQIVVAAPAGLLVAAAIVWLTPAQRETANKLLSQVNEFLNRFRGGKQALSPS